MNTFLAFDGTDEDGNPLPVVAVDRDPADEIDGTPVTDNDLRREGASAMLSALVSAVFDGMERVKPEDRPQAIAVRFAAFARAQGRQPLGCTSMTQLAGKLGVTKNAISAAAAQIAKRLLPGTS